MSETEQAAGDIDDEDEWTSVWNARMVALEAILGKSADKVFHSPIPFSIGGGADVLIFPNYQQGVAYVTTDMTGPLSAQPPNWTAKYELMICVHEEAAWPMSLLSGLSRYTLESQLNPGDTMDCPIFQNSELAALLFTLPEPVHEFSVLGEPAMLLLCIGITAAELELARREGDDALVSRLKLEKIFPFTELTRRSCV